MRTLPLIAACMLLALGSIPAHAQTKKIYRCGNSYSDQPCPGGSTVEADDSRTAAQRKAHNASVQRERHVADRMEKDRVKQEQAALRAAEQTEKTAGKQAAERKNAASSKKKQAAGKDKLPAYKALGAPGNQ